MYNVAAGVVTAVHAFKDVIVAVVVVIAYAAAKMGTAERISKTADKNKVRPSKQ